MEKHLRLLKEAQAAAKSASDIAAKAKADGDRDLTEAERAEYQKHYDLAVAKKAESDQAKKDADSQALLAELSGSKSEPGDDAPEDGRFELKDRSEQLDLKSFGERFVKSNEYVEFRKAHPTGVGNGSPVQLGRVKVGSLKEWQAHRKALTSPQARVQPTRYPTIDQVERDQLTFLDLIGRGTTEGAFEYVQITGVTRNAKIVPEATSGTDDAALKPTSELATQLADAKPYTYADGYDVTNQLLADAPAFAAYMDVELQYSLNSVVEEKLLNGSGTSGEPRGIYNTTGVQQVTYTYAAGADTLPTDDAVKAFIRATRLAIMRIVRLRGGRVDAIVLSPEMDAALDLLQDNDGRYYAGGPFGGGAGTLHGRPRVTSERLTDSHAVLGDFKQVALLDREGLSVLAFNQHKDYAQRNMTYVRAELRASQVIWKPNRLAIVKPAA
jgi:HK97 family phage major capsid protein